MKILFLAFEGEARLMARLAMRFRAKGHAVRVVSCDHFTVTHSCGEVFDYYRQVGLADSEIGNLDGVFRDMNSQPPDLAAEQVDWAHLERFERSYCQRFGLLELAAMDPLMFGAYHHRDIYYQPENRNLFYKYLELQTKWLEGILVGEKVDAVVTLNFQYFVKALAFTMSEALRIPFVMIGGCRVADLCLLYDNFSLGTPDAVRAEMERLQAVDDPCLEAEGYIAELKRSRGPAYTDFELTMQSIRERWRIGPRLHELWQILTRYPRRVLFTHRHYRGMFRRDYFLPSYLALVRTMAVAIWRRIRYFHHPALNAKALPAGKFVFFPLHLIPENSVLTLSRTFDEMECLFQLAKALPIDWKVVVKINPNMLSGLDSHPNSYYLRMSQIPNVVFANPLMSSGEIIEHSEAVACISGTALFEAAVYGKPGVRWGRTEFEVLDGIQEFDPQALAGHLRHGPSTNLNFYVQACFNLGLHLDYRLLTAPVTTSLASTAEAEYTAQLGLLADRLAAALKLDSAGDP